MSTSSAAVPTRWDGAWIDALAFIGGLATAWFADWKAADLVWSLWLSSLVVGYAMILWNLTGTLREFGGNVVKDPGRGFSWIGGALLLVIGFLFGLAFFTVHFGGFHFVHSVFLSIFFPLAPTPAGSSAFPNLASYVEVLRQYWIFLPVAFLAERGAFVSRRREAQDTAVSKEAIEQRQRAAAGSMMIGPYKNVVRMHLLIFFFVAAHFAKIENFVIYAVVYAVYFFPWRLVKRTDSAQQWKRKG